MVRAVTSWDAAPGTVAVSAAVARRLAALKHMDAKEHDPGSCATDANVQVRGVEVCVRARLVFVCVEDDLRIHQVREEPETKTRNSKP